MLLDTAGVSQRDIQMLEQAQLLYEGAPELKRLYPDAPIPAILLQDYTVNSFLQWEPSKWFNENGAKVDNQTFEN